MSSTSSSREGLSSLPRLLRTGALLVYVLATLVVPVLHGVAENGHGVAENGHGVAAGTSGFVVTAACPVDCHDPGHRHHVHDHANCVACQTHDRLATRTVRVCLQAPLATLALHLDSHTPDATHWQTGTPCLRGPPASFANA